MNEKVRIKVKNAQRIIFCGWIKFNSENEVNQSYIQNQISLNLGILMTAQESKILRIQLYHPIMGIHNFDINSRESFSDLRAMLSQHTQMTIFENFRFEVNGKLLPEFQEIGQTINNQTRINLVLQPFDQKSSHYHLQRVKDVLACPIQWVMLNSRQAYEQKQFPIEKLPENVSIDNFLDSKIGSPLYQSSSCGERHINFLQQLNFSIHNPPPMYRKLAGDYFYLQIKTLQGHEEHVTACPQGFYVNNSTNSCLNTTNTTGIYFYNLFDLLKYLSPKFKQTFNNLKNIFKVSELDKAIFSSFKSPPMCQWVKQNSEGTHKKSKQNNWRYLSFDVMNDNNATIKDWNEIIQLNSIMLNDSHIEISNKQKNQYKLYQDFVTYAKQSAMKAVDCQIRANNPDAPFTERCFNYGYVSIFFVDDDPLSYSLHENSKLTRKAINEQINNLEYLENNNTHNLSFKHTVLVSYKGHNVVVQTVIPGVKLSESNSKTQKKNSEFHNGEKSIDQLARKLKLENRNIYRKQNNQIERALIHPQLELVRAEDNRQYLLNLYTLSVRDMSFPGAKNNAFFLRRQLISSFNAKQNCQKNLNTMIESGYNLVFNERITQSHLKMKSIKSYAQQIIIPLCIQSFLHRNKKYLADSNEVLKVLHNFGLTSGYLGLIYQKLDQYDAYHIKIIIERVILVKGLKNLFKQAFRKTELGDIKNTICRLLNCIFSSEVTLNSMDELIKEDLKDETSTNASRKKKKKTDFGTQNTDDQILIKVGCQVYSQIKPFQLWQQIKQIISFRYNHKFTESKIYLVKCMEDQFGKCAVLRDLCINLGLSIQKIDYFQKQGIIFKPENIQQIKPIVRSISFSNKHLVNLIQQGDILIERKKIQQAIQVYNQAINYATSNLGIMTEQLALLNKKISQIYFRIGEIDAALLFIHCSQKMCEKIYGETHVETIECYHLLSQFNFCVRNLDNAEFFLLKAIHITTVSYGEQYPELIIAYLNLSSIYQASFRYMDSITCNSHALRIVLKVFGQNHLNTAICYAAMSTAHFEIPDIQKAIYFQQKSIEILKNNLKSDDPRLKEAQKILEHYNNLQSTKRVRENYEKQRKKIMSNPQLYAGLQLFRIPQYNPKQREIMFRKMQNMMQFTAKYFM